MDKDRFNENSPGSLVAIDLPTKKKDWAFIPRKLPPDWEFPYHLWPLVSEAREACGTLNGIGQILPKPDLLLRPLQRREAITSSNIEGTFVTPEQLLLYELDPHESPTKDGERSEWREVYNYGRALEIGMTLLEELPVCSRVMLKIHEVLMAGTRSRFTVPGSFRTLQALIGSSGRFIPPPPSEIQSLMDNLEEYINTNVEQYDPLVLCYIVHYQFETIHPFGDGNGRVGRVLLALMICKSLGHTMPWLYMSAYYERYRDEYVQNLFNVSANGDWDTWIEFCLRGTIEQANDSVRRCLAFNELRENMHTRHINHSPRTHTIIENLFKSPMLTIPTIAKEYGVSYPTAKDDIYRLLDAGILHKMKYKRVDNFYSHEILRITHDDE